MISTLAGEVRKLIDHSERGSFSPDLAGSQIAFWKADKYWIMGRNGENPTPIMTLDPRYDFQGPKWSPDGRRVVYRKNKYGSREGSIEARTIADGTTTVVLSGLGLQDFWWTADGRLIYSQSETFEDTNDLWEVRIDGKTAQKTGEPQRLTHWVGYAPGLVSVSTDGKRIITTKGYHQTDVYVADLEADGHSLKTERRLTADTRFDWPGGWTRDGKEILFFSDRNGTFNVFKQNGSASNPDLIVGGGDNRNPQISPDGQWLLYMVWPDDKAPGPVRIMRATQTGGSSDVVLEAKGSFAHGVTFTLDGEQDIQRGAARSFPDFRCPVSERASCVLAEADQEDILFTFFDPVNGRGSEAARVHASPAKFFWDVSPDGSQLAYGEFKSEENDSIVILTLKDGRARQLQLVGQSNLSSLSWAAGGRGLFVTTKRREGSDLLYIGLDGSLSVLRQDTGRVFVTPRPSANGRFLAYAVRTTDSNVWLLERK
jgi:Tol biopolymer transport system component